MEGAGLVSSRASSTTACPLRGRCSGLAPRPGRVGGVVGEGALGRARGGLGVERKGLGVAVWEERRTTA
jgi:hypothetical protein